LKFWHRFGCQDLGKEMGVGRGLVAAQHRSKISQSVAQRSA
jgi:hypothetical protein